MIGQGVLSFSSHSCAAGRITSAAKPCTQSRTSFWSWVRASEKLTSVLAALVIASTAASAASVESATDVADIEGAPFSYERGRTGVRRSEAVVQDAQGRKRAMRVIMHHTARVNDSQSLS